MTYEDEEFERIMREQAMGWRKRQVERTDDKRNQVIEDVAECLDRLKDQVNTAQYFAAYVRNLKR